MNQGRFVIAVVAVLVAGNPALGALPASVELEDATGALAGVRERMRAMDYEGALAALGAGQFGEAADYAGYLKAVALARADKGDEAVRAAQALREQFPESPWVAKSWFLEADVYAQRRDYRNAEAIYSVQAERLLSQGRKEEVARLYIAYAEEVSQEPDPNDLDAPKPDYQKAFNLYQKALEVECGPELADLIAFRIPEMAAKLGHWQDAATHYRAYLHRFDSFWRIQTEGPGSGRQERVEREGARQADARLGLARVLLAAGDQAGARGEIENLVTALGRSSQPLNGTDLEQVGREAAWLLPKTFGMPEPADDQALARGVQAAKEFLNRYRNDPRSVTLAGWIPRAYGHRGHVPEAARALEAFLAQELFALPEGETLTREQLRELELEESPLESWERLRREATARLGDIAFQQKDYDTAIAHYQRYVSQFPEGPHWSSCQGGILNARFQIGADLVAAEKYDEARTKWDAFLAEYPLDGRSRQILFAFGQMDYVQAQKAKEAHPDATAEAAPHFRNAIAAWSRLVSKYPDTEESSLAQLRIAEIQEQELGDLDKALEAYRKLTWGSHAGTAAGRVQRMTEKELTLVTERVFGTDEPAKIRLDVRNIDKVTIKVYRLDMEAYFRKYHRIGQIENLDIGLIDPSQQWEVDIRGYAKYRPITQFVDIPLEGPGTVAVNVSERDLEATTLVVRSDLQAIFKTSRRQALAFVENRREAKPEPGAAVLVSVDEKVVFEGKTGDDGVLLEKLDELKEGNRISFFVHSNNGIASSELGFEGLRFSTGLIPKGYLYTDRTAYRPGESVHVKGILRAVKDGAYGVEEGRRYTISVTDPQGRLMHSEETALSRYGTFTSELVLPPQAAVGEYTVLATPVDEEQQTFQGTFQVQRFRLEKVQLLVEPSQPVAFRGDILNVTFTARYSYGQPLADRPIRYTLPDGRSFVEQTDADGILAIEFDTTPLTAGRLLAFHGRLEQEGVESQAGVMLADVEFGIAMQPSRPVVLAGEPVELTIVTTGADGKPLSREVAITALRREVKRPNPVLNAIPWIQDPNAQTWADVELEQKTVRTGEDGTGRVTFVIEQGGQITFRAQGTDRYGNPVVGSAGILVSDEDEATRLRIFSDRQHLKVGETVEVTLHSRIDPGLVLITFEGEEILAYRVQRLEQGKNPVAIAVGHEHFPNFRLAAAAMRGTSFHEAAQEFTVERELKVRVAPSAEVYVPGATATVRLEVTDSLGAPVRAELSLSLVEQALVALYPDPLEPIVEFFQKEARREAALRTTHTAGFRYAPETRQVKKDITAEELRVETEGLVLRSGDGGARAPGYARARGVVAAPEAPAASVPAEVAGELMPSSAVEDSRRLSVAHRDAKAVDRAAELGQIMVEEDAYLDAALGRDLLFAGERPAPRREVPSAGVWIGAVETDENGIATVELPMPDKTTAYRFLSRGCTVETLVGQAEADAIVRSEFFADLKLPALLVEGDKARALVHVHNLSDFSGKATLKIGFDPGAASGAERTILTQEIDVQAKQTAEFVFPSYTVPATERLEVTLLVDAGEGRTDRVARTIEVRPWGMPYSDYAGGTAEMDETVFLTLPEGRYTSRWMRILIGPSVERSVIDMVLPPPCRVLAESVAIDNRRLTSATELLGVAGVLDYLQQVGRAYASDTPRVRARGQGLVSGLVATQREDGGWSWVGSTDTSDPSTSARAFWALALARRSGLAVDDAAFGRARDYLLTAFQQASQTDNELKARIQSALSYADGADFAFANRLYRERHSLSPAGQACTVLLLANLERKEMAAEVLDLLLSQAKPSTENEKRILRWSGERVRPDTGDDLERAALVLLALERVQPAAPQVADLVTTILEHRGAASWRPYKSGGLATLALARYYAETRFEQSVYMLRVRVNDTEVESLTVDGRSVSRVIEVPVEALSSGRNRVAFDMEGRGAYTYAVTLTGFSPDIVDPKSWQAPGFEWRKYYHDSLEYKGRPIGQSSQEIAQLEAGKVTRVYVAIADEYVGFPLVIHDYLPAGATLLEDSLSGSWDHYEIGDGMITFYLSPREVHDFEYRLVGYAPGEYRVLPPVMADVDDPSRMRVGAESALTVLAPGETSSDPYTMNSGELYGFGEAHFNDGEYAKALEYLNPLWEKDRPFYEKEQARMQLWLHTQPEHHDAQRIVAAFEILRERYPELSIPFEKTLVVGKAYRQLEEFERAYLVYRACIQGSFEVDSRVAATLEDQGEFLGSVAYMLDLWRGYPDTAAVTASLFALSQTVYAKAPEAENLRLRRIFAKGPLREKEKEIPTREDVIRRAVGILYDFLALHPRDPLADDAGFSLANAFLDLEAYERAAETARDFRRRYPTSKFLSSFQYMEALGEFHLRRFDAAVEMARLVADSTSEDRNYATYILGQVFHAQRKVAQALENYRRVREQFPDAAQAIEYFERKTVALEDVVSVTPGQPATVSLTYRNVDEVNLQVYRVDLMKLYLAEQSLDRMADIQLAGVDPVLARTVALDGAPYGDHEAHVSLQIKDEGAYLLLARGGEQFASGMLLVTPLAIDVQEDATSGRVRANVYDASTRQYLDHVHVKVVGSADGRIQAGETDMRGIFIADGVQGKPTVIARDADSRFAFHRGETWLGPEVQDQQEGQLAEPQMQQQMADFRSNLGISNSFMQDANLDYFQTLVRNKRAGVQVFEVGN